MCCAIAHPAKLAIPTEIEAIKCPTLWICAETDGTFPEADRVATQEILQKRGMKATFKLYPGTEHGFAVRGDDKNPVVREASHSALDEAIKFFKEELSA